MLFCMLLIQAAVLENRGFSRLVLNSCPLLSFYAGPAAASYPQRYGTPPPPWGSLAVLQFDSPLQEKAAELILHILLKPVHAEALDVILRILFRISDGRSMFISDAKLFALPS